MEDIGRLIEVTSLVFMTSGMYIRDTLLLMILVIVPSIPHIVVGTMSKLKICDSKMTKKNCLIRLDSGFTLR